MHGHTLSVCLSLSVSLTLTHSLSLPISLSPLHPTLDIYMCFQVHAYDSASSNQQCCESELISTGLSCCNGNGFNPASQVCADKSNMEDGKMIHILRFPNKYKVLTNFASLYSLDEQDSTYNIQINSLLRCSLILFSHPGCGSGTVCNAADSSNAFCNRCNFNRNTNKCGSFTPSSTHSITDTTTTIGESSGAGAEEKCLSEPTRIYSGLDFSFVGKNQFK